MLRTTHQEIWSKPMTSGLTFACSEANRWYQIQEVQRLRGRTPSEKLEPFCSSERRLKRRHCRPWQRPGSPLNREGIKTNMMSRKTHLRRPALVLPAWEDPPTTAGLASLERDTWRQMVHTYTRTWQMDVLIVCIAAMLFASFFSVVVYYIWRPRPGDFTCNGGVVEDTGLTAGSRPAAGRRILGIDWGRPLFRREITLERNTFPLTSIRASSTPETPTRSVPGFIKGKAQPRTYSRCGAVSMKAALNAT
ncbi:hypothetical protein FLONG3_2525 [Fusarium longipes]|uniref:Uncharacterized protein n=1 Tax=Fusarium longipes TaxID=694270 RepID=A0A395T4A2_9HYPO|nr:hypothetical protein FLONG3_2525 [Fusarium longipes]